MFSFCASDLVGMCTSRRIDIGFVPSPARCTFDAGESYLTAGEEITRYQALQQLVEQIASGELQQLGSCPSEV